MLTRTNLENEILQNSARVNTFGRMLLNCKTFLQGKEFLRFHSTFKDFCDFVNAFDDFLIKYRKFLEMVNVKFSLNIIDSYNMIKSRMNIFKKDIIQIKTLISKNEYDSIKTIVDELLAEHAIITKEYNNIVVGTYLIDYSQLDAIEWKLVGIPSIHYRSRVFISYPFRDDDPKKDTNQQLIDNYIITVLGLLNIEPIIARSRLLSQDLIDDEIINLVKNCDGIIGFYTENDSIENVEHELSASDNIIAIYVERGSKGPSMRRSRLQRRFNREQIGELILQIIADMKDKRMFTLMI